MSPIPSRLLRAQAQSCRSRPSLSERDLKRRDFILEAATKIFIEHGPARVTLTQFAYATSLSQVTIRRLSDDMPSLFGRVLLKHLDNIIAAISAVPRDGPDRLIRCRAAYFRATRGNFDIPRPLHFLLLRDRFSLPEDILEPIEQQRRVIGFMVGGDDGEDALCLLDHPITDLQKIEAAFAAMQAVTLARQNAPPPAPRPPDILPPEPAPPPKMANIGCWAAQPMSRLDPQLSELSDEALRTLTTNARPAEIPPRNVDGLELINPSSGLRRRPSRPLPQMRWSPRQLAPPKAARARR